MKLSVVVATYNRAPILEETLGCLEAQTLEPDAFEVIVVDDGSSDETAAVVDSFRRRARIEVTYLHHENQGPGFTQNRGIREARAPLVLLMADDIFTEPDTLAAHLRAHERYPEKETAILGNVLQSPRLREQSLFLRFWEPFQIDALPADEALPFTFFWACNISLDREFMLARGMFHEGVGPGGAAGHEDVELGFRLHQHGLRIVHVKDALSYHFHPDSLDTASRRAFHRGLNWHQFQRLVPHPELAVRYKVCTWRTLGEHLRALFGNGDAYVADDVSLLRIVKLMSSSLVFNRWSVPYFWVPFLERAERSGALTKLVRSRMYIGVIYFHFMRGIRQAPGA